MHASIAPCPVVSTTLPSHSYDWFGGKNRKEKGKKRYGVLCSIYGGEVLSTLQTYISYND